MSLTNLTDVKVAGPGILTLSWEDGVTRDVDVSGWLTKHPLLRLLNAPEVFRDVALVEGGGGVEWANGADFSAEALRALSDEQHDSPTRQPA
ncbi:MAG: DUF2442 domain-containing protein [Pseudomonadota bacterium]